MKKILASLILLAVTAPAFAHHGGRHHGFHHGHHFNHHRHWHHDHRWVAPLIIGGAVTYALTRPAPIIVQEPPIVIEPPVDVIPGTNCTAWREIQQSNGTVVRERICRQ